MPGILNLFIFGNIIYLLVGLDPGLYDFKRMFAPYDLLEIFVIPPILKIIKKPYNKYLFLILILIYGAIKLQISLSAFVGYPSYVPYRSVLN
jgi:hypothetical protein